MTDGYCTPGGDAHGPDVIGLDRDQAHGLPVSYDALRRIERRLEAGEVDEWSLTWGDLPEFPALDPEELDERENIWRDR